MKMKKYKGQPVIIEAIRWYPGMKLDYVNEKGMSLPESERSGFIWNSAEEQELEVRPGDWIIKGIEGELYPCTPSIFAARYQLHEELEPKPTARRLGWVNKCTNVVSCCLEDELTLKGTWERLPHFDEPLTVQDYQDHKQ